MDIQLKERIGLGATSEGYAYGDDRVVKLFLSHTKEDAVRFEYEKTKSAYENGLPAPRVYEMVQYRNRFGFIMQRIAGNSLMDIMFQY